MDRFHKHKWLLGIALLFLAGCRPQSTAQEESRQHAPERPLAVAIPDHSRDAIAPQHAPRPEPRERVLPPGAWTGSSGTGSSGTGSSGTGSSGKGTPLTTNSATRNLPQGESLAQDSNLAQDRNLAQDCNLAQGNRFAPRPLQLERGDAPQARSYQPAYFDNLESAVDSDGSRASRSPAAEMAAPTYMRAPSPAATAASSAVADIPAAAFHSVDVLYATDRKQARLSLSESQFNDQRQLISLLGIGAAAALVFSLLCWMRGRPAHAKLAGGMAAIMACGAVGIFATTLQELEKQGVTYSGDRGELVRGVCRVTVPVSHTRGTVERPSLLKFEVAENQAKHIVLTSVSPLGQHEFEDRLEAELAAAEQPDLLVFIHGYNVDFESAVLRTAQIAVDLPFRGIPICYSWPSQGTLLGYPIDENNAAWTVGHLKQFLGELVDRSGAQSIHVVAHSMGNRAMTSALQQMAHQRGGGSPPLFDRVVLAAPDVDADLFRRDLAASLTQVARQVTLYASSHDQALVASKKVHGYPRAGETGDHLVVVPGVDTIDVSGIDLSLLGHSYYGDSEPILRDLHDVLLSRLPATQRQSLISRVFQSQIYWQLATGKRIATGTTR